MCISCSKEQSLQQPTLSLLQARIIVNQTEFIVNYCWIEVTITTMWFIINYRSSYSKTEIWDMSRPIPSIQFSKRSGYTILVNIVIG